MSQVSSGRGEGSQPLSPSGASHGSPMSHRSGRSGSHGNVERDEHLSQGPLSVHSSQQIRDGVSAQAPEAQAPPPGLELEHALGLAGEVFDGLHFHPDDGDTYIYPAGACIVMAKLSDPHQQTFLRGHDESISCLQMSPKGTFIASGQTGEHSDVVVWDTQSLQLLFRFQEHDYGIAELEFSDDERLLISAGLPLDNRMYIWDLATGCINAHVHLDPCPTLTICFGKMYRDFKKRLTGLYQFATLGEGSLCIWALDPMKGLLTRSKMEKSDLSREIVCAQFDGDKQEYLYGGTSSGEVVALHVRSLQPAMSSMICSAGIGAIKWIPNGIIAAGGDGSVILLKGQGASLAPEMRLYLEGSIRSISIRPEKFIQNNVMEVLVGSTAGKVYHCRLDTSFDPKDLAHTYTSAMSTMRDRPPSSVRSPKSVKSRQSGEDRPSMDPRIMLVSEGHASAGSAVDEGAGSMNARGVGNLSQQADAGIKSIHQTEVRSISFAPDSSEQFATAGSDNSIRSWDMNEYSSSVLVHEKDAGHPECIDFSYDMLVSGWDDCHIRCYLTELDEDMLREIPERQLWTLLNAHKSPISSIKVARNQRFMISGGCEGALRVWSLRNREMVSDLQHHSSKISRVLLYNDDAHAISSSKDKSIVCWDLRREQKVSCHVQRMGGINDVALSADQSLVFSVGQDRRISFWDLRQPEPIQQIRRPHDDSDVTCIDASSGGNLLATGGGDGIVNLWDIRNGARIQQGVGHSATIHQMSFSPDERQLVSVGGDGCVLIWNIFQ